MRVLAAAVLTAVLLAGLFPSHTVAAMPQCVAPTANKFLGNGKSASGLIGVYSEIERLGKSLCTQGSTLMGSWSLSWVSVEGPQTDATPGIDIYQGGYAQCPPANVGSCPYNAGVLYNWDYYAHEQGACGLAYNTGFIDEGNPTSGYHFFQISKVGSFYNFYIDEVFAGRRPLADIETCWPGVVSVEWQNEMLNNNDQGGGRTANPQGFHKNQYQNATGWHQATRTAGSACDANSYPAHWHCNTSPTANWYFDAYDDRVP
jgi:hypothetical protein